MGLKYHLERGGGDENRLESSLSTKLHDLFQEVLVFLEIGLVENGDMELRPFFSNFLPFGWG